METLNASRGAVTARRPATPAPAVALRSPRKCASWLDAMMRGTADSLPRLQAMQSLVDAIRDTGPGETPRIEVLETVRAALVTEAARVFDRTLGAPVPHGPDDAQALRAVDHALASLGEVYAGAFEALEMERAPHRVIPEAVEGLRAILPIARALDAQSRRLSGLLLARVHLDDAQFGRLAELAQIVRRSTFLDVNLRDPHARMRPCNSRALFVLPLLLRLAEPWSCPAAEVRGLDWLTRRLAYRVGFRIDEDGHKRSNPHGPTLRAGPGLRVRLDTHRISDEIDAVLGGQPGARRDDGPALEGPGREALAARGRERWAAGWRFKRPAEVGRVRMRVQIGWPSAADVSPGGRPYDWGRYDGNVVPGRVRQLPGDDAGFMLAAEPALWTATEQDVWVVERGVGQPAATRNGLVIVATEMPTTEPVSSQRRATGPRRLRLARAMASEHLLAGGGERLRLRPIAGEAQAVGLGPDGHAGDAFWLVGDAEDVGDGRLLAARGRLEVGMRVVVAMNRDDLTFEVYERLDRGADFEIWRVGRPGRS